MVHLIPFVSLTIVLYSIKYRAWKIGDFGLAVRNITDEALLTTKSAGTPIYRAPELLRSNASFTHAADMWALGCIFYLLVFRKMAFDCEENVRKYAKNEFSLKIPDLGGIQSDERRTTIVSRATIVSRTIELCLNVHPSFRPHAKEMRKYFFEPTSEWGSRNPSNIFDQPIPNTPAEGLSLTLETRLRSRTEISAKV